MFSLTLRPSELGECPSITGALCLIAIYVFKYVDVHAVIIIHVGFVTAHVPQVLALVLFHRDEYI